MLILAIDQSFSRSLPRKALKTYPAFSELNAMSIEGAAKELNAQAEIQEVAKIHIRPE